MRFLPVNQTCMLVELTDLEQTLALLTSLQHEPILDIEEMVPAARTILIRFRPHVNAVELASKISKRDTSVEIQRSGRLIEIPVQYEGEDLEHVSKLTGLSVEEVIRRHTESEFTVAFCGFAPGFAYLMGGDPALYVPRRETPRTIIPAGSVALAGNFSGVYPQNSPGGWQLIGTTPLKMWDASRNPSSLLQPGNRVRFLNQQEIKIPNQPSYIPDQHLFPDERNPHLKVLTAPLPALFQDLGRWGQASQGISASGALDRSSLKAANRVVGNPTNTPCLEFIPGGFSLKSTARVVIACAGAPCSVTIQDTKGHTYSTKSMQPMALEPGDIVKFGQAQAGVRCYLAVRGGFEINEVLGSAATDTLAVLGPKPVITGTVLGLKNSKSDLMSVSSHEVPAFDFPVPGEDVVLDVVLGPRTDWFTSNGLETLIKQRWQITAGSSRVGIKLFGDVPIERDSKYGELPSESTVTGSIQVTHTGQPVLFLADHPLTGGYPVIGAVAEHHLDILGQLPVHTHLLFRPLAPFAEISQ